MTALDELWPDEDRRDGALDDCLDHVLHPNRLPSPLTATEIVTLRLYSHGQTTPMIAEQLCLSFHTVKARTKIARQKLGAKTTTEACCEALRLGLIP